MPRKYKKALLIILILVAGLGAARLAWAQTANLGLNYVDNLGLEPGAVSDPRVLLANIVKYLLTFVGLIAICMILYGGFLWMTARGEAEKISKAKKILISAIIGLLIIISAYFIVAWVIKITSGVISPSATCDPACTGGDTCCSDSVCRPFCGTTPPTSDSVFKIKSTFPRQDSTNMPRTVVVKIFLNMAVSPTLSISDLDGNIKIQKTADYSTTTKTRIALGSPVPPVALNDVVNSLDGKMLSVSASADCGDEKGTKNCFGAWSYYEVTVNSGIPDLTSIDSKSLDCTNGLCKFEFMTNDVIDTSGPKAGISPLQICTPDVSLSADANTLSGWGRDDVGISEIAFDQAGPISTVIADIPGTGAKLQSESVTVDTSAMTVGQSYRFSIRAYDMSDSLATASTTAIVRMGHCCNGVLDSADGEEDVDCGGPDCDSCSKLDPIITLLSPDNGAPGNWITIYGRYFGSVSGKVYFSSSIGTPFDILAEYPSADNPNCTDNWQNGMIIVKVPAGAHTGPVKVEKPSLRFDTTDNENGPILPDFAVNGLNRPGLCLIDPVSGYFGQSFILEGKGFLPAQANEQVYFGDSADLAKSIKAAFAINSNTQASATVPNIKAGMNTVYLANGSSSNSLYYKVTTNADKLPIIDYLDPEKGPKGQYVTIYGSRFGSYDSDNSKVYFSDGTDSIEANGLDFPKECQNYWWTDKQIIIKVPDGVSLLTYEVTVANGNGASSPKEFTVIDDTPGPGICLLKPHNGNVGAPIDVYGDNFQDTMPAGGFVRFYNNVDGAATSWENQNIKVPVPVGAMTGPVKVSDGTHLSNGLQFTVGLCSSNVDCDVSEECCGGGTAWSGICRTIGDCGTGIADLSGYGWTFSVGDGLTVPATCGGYSDKAACLDAPACPNSPGDCQTKSDLTLDKACSDDSCNSNFSQCKGSCTYDPSKNLCVTALSCSTNNISFPKATCRAVGAKAFWQESKANNTCPLGTYPEINGWCTVGTALLPSECDLCQSGFACSGGTCAVNSPVCPANSTCTGGVCVLNHDICECCCKVDDPAACCAGLSCVAGGCGNDPANYGLCSGCRVDDAGAMDQAASDNACNCTGTTGKYCYVADPGDSADRGVCQDATPCNLNLDSPTCDPDSTKCNSDEFCDDTDCVCRKGRSCDNDLDASVCGAPENCDPATQHCDTADCFCKPGKSCDDNFDVLDGCGLTTNCDATEDCDPADCTCKKKSVPIGDSCDVNRDASLVSCDPFHCDAAYQCLTGGVADVPPDDQCGHCCCDVSLKGKPGDTCKKLSESLYCDYNKTTSDPICNDADPAVLPNVGICCGCKSDAECNDAGNANGCGSDICCHPRPRINSTVPADGATEICRNASIEATFNSLMDANSFAGNVIVLGDYGSETCPAGTQYLAKDSEKEKALNVWEKMVLGLKSFGRRFIEPFLGKDSALAFFPVDSGSNFCAVKGATSGFNDTSGHTILNFKIGRLLDANKTYYVIIRGDANRVKSSLGIGLNPVGSPGGTSLSFNKLTYPDSYVWSFKTLPDTGDDHGICRLKAVEVQPDSYLFQTNTNDTADDDTGSPATFDTIKDSDKVFIALAKESKGQAIVSIPNVYSWDWDWTSENKSVITVNPYPAHSDLNFDKTLVIPEKKAREGQSVITATAKPTSPAYGFTSAISGTAVAYLFLCENPWPPVAADGSWSPWGDTDANCAVPYSPSDCQNTNYQMYYCRDNGGTGSLDDLPNIRSDSLNLKQTFACSIAGGSACSATTPSCVGGKCASEVCSLPGGDCIGVTDGEQCIGECKAILKESFFFRSEASIANKTLTVAGTGKSGEVDLSWTDIVPDAGEYLDYYKVYYGLSAGDYKSFKKVSLSEPYSAASPYAVTGLTNGVTYYFAVTATYVSGAESPVSNSVSAVPNDASTLPSPTGFTAVSGDKSVILAWTPVVGAKSYQVYYGADAASFGSSQNVGNVKGVTISSLTNGQVYYFAVSTVGANLKEGPKSLPQSAKPLAKIGVAVIPWTQKLTLKWGSISGATEYSILYVPGTTVSAGLALSYDLEPLTDGTTYKIRVDAKNGANTIASSEELDGIPLAKAVINTPSGGDISANSIRLTWGSVSGASSYILTYKKEGGEYVTPKNIGNVSEYTVTKLYTGTTYLFVLQAADSGGNGSEKSDPLSVTTD